ncbi:MAG: type IV secretory system conjugative DNA transfer family protein [Eubacterium sp.]|nr:type IV secretory system conjugative DNA transfer family protein [Eubacterium sp.]
MVDSEKISEILKNYRKDRHLTQQELADFLCIQQKDISNLENNGSYTDRISKVCRVADFLNIPYEQIFENTIKDESFTHLFDEKPYIPAQNIEISQIRYEDATPDTVQSEYQNTEEATDMEYYNITDTDENQILEKMINKNDSALILSQNIRNGIFGQKAYEGEPNQNVCVIGSSGSGETCSLVIPNIEACYGNYVIAHPYLESMKETRNILRKKGYTIVDFNFDKEDENTALYDPFKNIDLNQDISDISHEIFNIVNILTTEPEQDAFFKDATRLLLTSLIAYYLSDPDTNEKMSFFEYFNSMIQQEEDELRFIHIIRHTSTEVSKAKEQYKKLDTRYTLKEIAVKNFPGTDKRTLQNIFISIALMLQRMTIYTTDSTPLIELLYTPDTCIIVDLPVGDYKYYNTNMALLMYQLFENGNKSVHHEALRYILDEFPNYDVPCIERFIAQTRTHGTQIMTLVQSIYQLKAKNQMGVLSNSKYIVYLGSPSDEDNKYISGLCGYKTIKRNKENDNYKYVPKKTEVPVISVNDLRMLKDDECLVITSNEVYKDKKFRR